MSTEPGDKPLSNEPTANEVRTKPTRFGGWFLLIGIAVFVASRIFTAGPTLLKQMQVQRQQEERRQRELSTVQDAMATDIREGRASDTVLILNGIDPKEYRKRFPRQQNSPEAKSAASVPAIEEPRSASSASQPGPEPD